MKVNLDTEYKKDVLGFALSLGELMLINGAETYRVEDTVLRICNSRGFNHINVFASPTVIIISDYKFDGFSFMKSIKNRSIDLYKISLLNDFSRKFVNNSQIDMKKAIEEVDKINSTSSYSNFTQYISTGIGSAFFAGLVEGNDIPTFVATFFTSILAVKIYNKIIDLSTIPAFACLISSSFIAFIGVILSQLNIISTPTMLVVGSIMPLLPGVSFIKGIRDLISGDLMSGVARAFDAVVIAVSIASGVGIMLDIWLRLGGVL